MKAMTKSVLIGVLAVSVVAIGMYSVAWAGRGCGGGGGFQNDGRYQNDRYGCGGYGRYAADLSPEQVQQIKKAREAFFNDTRALRDSLFDKRLALRTELHKSNPDVAAATQLQEEVSALQSRLDRKHVEHIIEMRKRNPDAGRGFGYGGMGMGHGGRHMKGYGDGYRGGKGYCWRQ